VTQNDGEIEYSSYAKINTSDDVAPIISSYTPTDDFLFPIGNFTIEYEFSDVGSGIDIGSQVNTLQRWDGTVWRENIADTYVSLDVMTGTDALYQVTGLPYGRYRA
jgi:hypothetical protein